ncbi:MAG: hypothetical protein J6X89_03700 [Bacteroidales bacterium]|nr:hypothetical protein [Bacteroidales bacterium]
MKQIRFIENKKILWVDRDRAVFARGYILYSSPLSNSGWKRIGVITDGINSFLSHFSLTRRFTRAEITRYYSLGDGTELCIARKGIFRRDKGEKRFKKTFNVLRGSRPMNICEGIDGTLYFGEYFANMEKLPVHIYKSADSGRSWEVVYTFPKGSINHIHGIFFDPYTQWLWLATGDRENECVIGYTKDGFKTLNEVFRGGQEYRTCVLFFYRDFIVFGTDSQYIKNTIKRFDRASQTVEDLQPVQGPIIKGTQIGDFAMVSTDVEPSDVNKDNKAYIWFSKNGVHWETLYSAEKDWLNPTLFQFGVFDLPQYESGYSGNKFFATGKALKGCGGDTIVFEDICTNN